MLKIKPRKSNTTEERNEEKAKKELQKAGIQDEFQVRGFELVSWAQDHQKFILGVICALVLSAAAWSAFALYSERKDEQASEVYQKAVGQLAKGSDVAGKNQAAVAALRQLNKNFSQTKISGLAHLYAGYLSMELNAADEAAVEYQKFLKDFNGDLKPLALLGLAYAYEKSNKKDQALETFEIILNNNWGLSNEVNLWESARLASALKKWDLAKSRAKELKSKYPNSSFLAAAEEILLQAGQSKLP